MILRRITEHVKAQNWFAVGIDFLIVVVGVFVGLQVSNWNEARADATRANGYLERLHADLSSDAQAIDVRMEFHREVAEYGDRALAYAEADETERKTDWPSVLAFFQSSQLWPYSSNDATYGELRSAGELELIRNQDLRAALAEYYITGSGKQAYYIIRHVPDYRETIRGLTPSVVTKHIWTACHEEGGFEYQRLIDCDSPVSENEMRLILDAYLADPEVLTQLRFWMSTLETMQNLLAINKDTARILAAQIEAELEL
jgi:hypothetical protein